MEKSISEFSIIYEYLIRLAQTPCALNFQDDAAILDICNDEKLVVTVDTIIENRHFFAQDSVKSIATKLLETNLSDLASMGATPKYWTFAFSINRKKPPTHIWLEDFISTLLEIQKQSQIFLVGGDTTVGEGELTLSANAFGVIKKNKQALNKYRAKSGDIICVSNTIGDSIFGFHILNQKNRSILNEYSFLSTLSQESQQALLDAYLYPKAQVKLGEILLDYANACADISDGLVIDLEKICKFSNKKGIIRCNQIRFSKAVEEIITTKSMTKQDIITKSIVGGGDYQLVFTIPKNKLEEVKLILNQEGIFIQEIGEIIDSKDDSGLEVIDINNNILPLVEKGFEYLF